MASSGSSSNVSTATSTKRAITPSKGVSLAKKRRAATAAKSTKVTLENVLGLTCHSSHSLAVSDTYVAYPAGCAAVLHDPRKKSKKLHLINKKAISCLCLSTDGEYLATGEYGHQPCARVWDLKEANPEPCSVLKAHSFGIKCMSFTSDHKYLITFGYRYDRQVIFWNWKTGTQILYGKYGQPVNCLAISEDHTSRAGPNYFVTAHPRRIQYWYYDPPTKDGNKKKPATVVLKARSAILGDLQDNNFLAVVCGSGPLSANTYALSKSGKLLLIDNFRLVDKFTEIKASPAYSLVMNESYLFCGCSEGVIRLFDPYTLDYIITLPYPHPLGVDISAPVVAGDTETLHYPDALALVVTNNKLCVVYNDHSFYVWDVNNVKQVGKNRSFLFHSACVWDICTYPLLDDDSKQLLPESSFVTCSSDNTVRFWCLDPNSDQWNIRNIYSKELIRVLYNDSVDINCLKDMSVLPGDASAVADSSRGVRSIVIRHNGQHLAVGDREGNLRIYDLQFMDKIYEEVAHDSEILSLSYSRESEGVQYLATASRDRMVHVFSNSNGDYTPVQSLPDHSAAVTAVGFTGSPNDKLQLLSSGADKSIIFHTMEKDEEDMPVFNRSNHVVSKASIYDMAIDAFEKYFLTAGQDKFIRMYGVNTGKKHTVLKVPTSDDGSIIRVALDPSGLYAASSVGDKSVLIFDIYTGECIAKISGHSEVVTQLTFSSDCKHLYTVSGDSCIFVWKLWPELTKTMHERLAEIRQAMAASSSLLTAHKLGRRGGEEEVDAGSRLEGVASSNPLDSAEVLTEQEMLMMEAEQPDFDFRLSMLPAWARKVALSRPSVAQQQQQQVASKDIKRVHSAESGVPSRLAEGKWAERLTESELTFASESRPGDFDSDFDREFDELPVRGLQRRKSDSAPELVDLEVSTPTKEVAVESPEVVVVESSPKSSGESDAEGEVLYQPSSSHHLDVDPKIFSVTTPTKPTAHLDDAEEDEESVTPNISPPRERHFLEANYQSLDKPDEEEEEGGDSSSANSNGGGGLNPISSRLSISSKFLRKQSRLQLAANSDSCSLQFPTSASEEEPLTPFSQGESLASPLLYSQGEKDLLSPATPVQATKGVAAPETDVVPLPPTDSKDDTPTLDKDSSSANAATALPAEEKTINEASKASFEQEVNETKKRLKNLGYEIPPKDKKAAAEKGVGLILAAAQPAAAPLHATPVSGKPHRSAIGIRKAKEIEGSREEEKRVKSQGAVPHDTGGGKTLSAKASTALSGLEANFRTLTSLGAEAIKAQDTGAMDIISKGLTTHKVKVVSWSNRNRKSAWKKKGSGGKGSGGGSGGGTPPSGAAAQEGDCSEGGVTPSGSVLGPKELEQATALVDQLKKLLSQ